MMNVNVKTNFMPFGVEEFMSELEQQVDYCFAESGVHPMRLDELMDTNEKVQKLLNLELNYPEVNGFNKLRTLIAGLYGETDPDKVLVTVGASEANFVVSAVLAGSGDNIAVLSPTYQQFPGLCKNNGCSLKYFYLKESEGWKLDADSLRAAVSNSTDVVHVVNPNNPTAKILTLEEMDLIVTHCRSVDAWLVVDEVYAGAEREGDAITPSFYSMYEKCVAIGSMSKAYGLPGLRIGWAIGCATVIAKCWRHHEYVAISSGMIDNMLAEEALLNRPRILQRTRGLIRNGWSLVQCAVEENSDILSVVPPQASAMCFLKYHLSVDSMTVSRKLATQEKILVVPGILFDEEFHLRFSFALPPDAVKLGLARLVKVLREFRGMENV